MSTNPTWLMSPTDTGHLAIAANLLVGAYYAQYVAGAPFDDDWSERVVDSVLNGLARPVSLA